MIEHTEEYTVTHLWETVPKSSASRAKRVEERTRPPHWRKRPLRIEQNECISCEACIEACPPQFGAIFNFEQMVAILPELCSGCDLCLPPVCPVDCIYEDPNWTPSLEELWSAPFQEKDSFVLPDGSRRPKIEESRIRRW